MSPADAFLLPLVGIVLLLVAALVGGIMLEAPSVTRPGVQACARSWDDPMVATHLWAALPFALAVYLRMPITACITLLAAVISIGYHSQCERGAVLPIADEIAASLLVVWTLIIFGVSITLKPNWGLVGACVAVLGVAVTAFFGGIDAAPCEDSTPLLTGTREAALCIRARLHPLWHLAGFVAVGLVLTNFQRTNVQQLLSTRPWLRALQEFHY